MSCMNRYGKPVVLDMMDLKCTSRLKYYVLYEQIWQACGVGYDGPEYVQVG